MSILKVTKIGISNQNYNEQKYSPTSKRHSIPSGKNLYRLAKYN